MIVVEGCPVRPSFTGNEWPSLCELNLDQRPWGYEANRIYYKPVPSPDNKIKKGVLMFLEV